jgi:hypothetical protein
MQQQALVAAGQGHYLTPVTLAQIPQAVTALAAPNGISTATMTPTTASLANGESEFYLITYFNHTNYVFLLLKSALYS